ncbi:MAG: ABC transporter permease [Phycisphaerales bacterium]|nr:ABC transporter permease [Phycisphaerales bacterium]
MIWVALRMLFGDRVKYLGLVLGVAFSTMLMVQQASIFVGVLRLSAYMVHANPDIDVWVTRPGVGATEIVEHMPESWLGRVRGVPGVAWATPMYRGAGRARGHDGNLYTVGLIGVDDSTLVGAPSVMLAGRRESLLDPDAAIVDIATFRKLFGERPLTDQPTIEIGKKLVRVVGVCRAVRTITGGDVIYTRRSVAVRVAQEPNSTVSFVMVKTQPGADSTAVARAIEDATGLVALTKDAFTRSIIKWTIDNTGIVQVLGSVILLSIVIGVLVVGQTFYLFAYENQRYFAAIKAMGATDARVLAMLAVQALVVSFVGYGLGVGGGTLILVAGDTDLSPMRGLHVEWSVAVAVGVLTPLLVLATALLAARRVVNSEPGIVFK